MAKPTLIEPSFSENDAANKDGDKTEPRLPDDDGGDEEMEIEVLEDDGAMVVYRPTNPDEQRRAFIFHKMADSSVDGKILVENMDAVCRWLKDGTMPKDRKLKSIEKNQ